MVTLWKSRTMVPLALITVLAIVATYAYVLNIRGAAAKEAILQEHRMVLDSAIAAYTMNRHRPPQAVSDLIDAGYLKADPSSRGPVFMDPVAPSKGVE